MTESLPKAADIRCTQLSQAMHARMTDIVAEAIHATPVGWR